MDINDKYREENKKRYQNMHAVKDVVMAIIILGVGLLMFFGKKFLPTQSLFAQKDPLILNLFGGLCLIYGTFRMYIAFKRKY